MGARGRGVEAPAQVGAAPLGRLQLGLGVDHLLRLEGEDNEGGLRQMAMSEETIVAEADS